MPIQEIDGYVFEEGCKACEWLREEYLAGKKDFDSDSPTRGMFVIRGLRMDIYVNHRLEHSIRRMTETIKERFLS